MPTKLFAVLLAASLMMVSNAPVLARPELGPPSIKLRANLANIAVAELSDISPDYQLTFQMQRNLHNEAEPVIVIRSDKLTSNMLEVGKSYVIGYTTWRVKRFPRVASSRADGGVIAHLPGASPAIFELSPLLIKMFEWDVDESLQSPAAMLPIILQGMASDNPQLQDFFSTELVTRPSLYQQLSSKQKQQIEAHLADSDYAPESRSLMLSDSFFCGQVIGQAKRTHIAQEIVTSQPVNIDAGSADGSLVSTAMHILQQSQQPAHAQMAQRWLSSNQPALVESAAAVIYELKPETLINALKQAMSQQSLQPHTKDTLTMLSKRYQRALNG